MRILVTGSRDWLDWRTFVVAMERAIKGRDDVTIVHGACPTGADAMADRWAHMRGLTVETHPADWKQGRRAGPLRNQAMVDAGADLCLAFPLPGSRGTNDCMNRARDAGIRTIAYEPRSWK